MSVNEAVKKTIVIDVRETKLIDLLNTKDIPIMTQQLNLGDIVFREGEHIRFLIERKTIGDLHSSIRDGRLRDQKKRMLDTFSKSQILYLIEGDKNFTNKFVQKKSIDGALYNISIRDNIPILTCLSIEESVGIILDLYTRFRENKSPFKSVISISQHSITLPSLKKRGNLDTLGCFQLQLCQIPGISLVKAQILANKWNNMSEMTRCLEKSNDALKELAEISVSKKRLGKKLAQSILYFLGFEKKS